MRRRRAVLGLLIPFFCAASPSLAAGTLRGSVLDSLGAAVPGATVTLLRGAERVNNGSTDDQGAFSFEGIPDDRYHLEVSRPGFETTRTDAVFVGGGTTTLDVRLQIGALRQSVLVTAAAAAVTQAETGASTTLVDRALIESLGDTDLLEPLRVVPGAAIVQTGARGGATSLFLRGGASNFTKILLDGIAANDIGGAFDFGDLATTGIEQVEVLRGSNSVLHGSDAMTGVVNITTRRGRTGVPEIIASIDGGNFSTVHGDAGVGGAVGRLDYFAVYSHLRTDNDVANSAYRNSTFATRFGARLGPSTDVSGTVRLIRPKTGSPNATLFYGIADDSVVTKDIVYTSMTARSQWAPRWQSSIRAGVTDQGYRLTNPTATGTRSDPSPFANYLSNTVTISNPAGQSVTGRAILDFGGTYPSVFTSTVNRRTLYGDTSLYISSALDVAAGARVETETGASDFNGSRAESSRRNYGAFAEARVTALNRLFVTAGIGVDRNEVFGTAASPRVSVAAYLRQPTPNDPMGDTKVTFNAGRGLKEPSVSQELSSLFALIPAATATSLGVGPVGPERSRTFDVGIEQGFARNRARARLAYFDNEFSDLIEFLSRSSLALVGVPPAAANATAFGAYTNAQSNEARGVEISGDAVFGRIRATASYTYVEAVVTASFTSGAMFPSSNPAFPGVRIGQFTPLVGNRPFRRPANSGSVTLGYADDHISVAVAGYVAGASDDSTFLSDAFFGTSLLLPNQDLNPAYQKVDISASYRVHPRARWYVTVENAFDKVYQAAAGYPALSRAVRSGVSLRLGGD